MHPFAAKFAEAWAQPTPERLVALLCDDVTLLQPHLPPIRGKAAARAELSRLLRWLPELHGDGFRAGGEGDVVFIEWRMRRSRTSSDFIPAVDRFLLRDGLGLERIVYFDQFRMMRMVLAHPSLWPGFLKYRFGR